ncbi:hypothetical protein B0H65DRAFT_502767, partial [Neurospora tetraspora]
MVEQGGGRAPHDHHSAPALKRKRGPSDYAAAHHTHDETQEQTQIERLPFEGGLLSQQAHNQVCFKNNGPNHKDHLELIGRGNSAVNWIAPERQIKKPGLQLVAKIALDDDSFEAFRKTIQREARGAGGVLANIWVQIHEPPTSEEETPTVVNGQSTAADIADKESPAPVVTEEIPVQGGSRPLSIGPPDQFRFGSPSSFTGTPFAKNPYAVQFANTGML